jgi:hypothetical protein
MHKICKSEAQLKGAPCSSFTLGTVLQHCPHATERIATLRFVHWRKIALKIFLEGCRSFSFFLSPDYNSGEFHLIIQTRLPSSFWPDYQAQQSLSCHFPHFACPPSHEGYTSKEPVFCLTFIKERILCKIVCHPQAVTKGRKYVCRSCLLHFKSPDLNSKIPQTLSSRILFPCIFVFLYQNQEKISFFLS